MSPMQAVSTIFFLVLSALNVSYAFNPFPTAYRSFSNSSGDYYISSKSTLTKKAVKCPSSKPCYVICENNCESVTVNAVHSPSLTMQCLNQQSCRLNEVHCPQNGRCEINCDGANSGMQMAIYVPNKSYTHLYIGSSVNASTPSLSLYETDIKCLDSGDYSRFDYSYAREEWVCEEEDCCPPLKVPGLTSMKSTAGEDQSVTCSADDKYNVCADFDIIDASSASSLSLVCDGDDSCANKRIKCPGADTSCDILCDGVNACNNMLIDIQDSNALNISCTDHLACVGLKIWPPQSKDIWLQSVSLSCQGVSSCSNVTFGYGANTTGPQYLGLSFGAKISVMDIECKAEKACEGLHFVDHGIGAVMMISTRIVEALTIECGASMACHLMDVSVMSFHNAKSEIICNNPSVSSNQTGACYRASFSLYGTQDLYGDHTVYCNAFDCQGARIGTNGLLPRHPSNTVRIHCDAPYACEKGAVSADSSAQVNLECTAEGSCFNMGIRGASYTPDATHIVCGKADNACAKMRIGSRMEYTQDYLSLSCPAGDAYKSSCANITFGCDGVYYPTMRQAKPCSLHYNQDAHYYDACASEGTYPVYGSDDYCCPLKFTPIQQDIITTTQPDAITTTQRDVITTKQRDAITTTEAAVSTAERTVHVTQDKHDNIATTLAHLTDNEQANGVKPKTSGLDIGLSVVLWSIGILLLIVFIFVLFCVLRQKKHRNYGGALLEGDVDDHSQESDADVEAYVAPTAGNDTSLAAETEMISQFN
eukprot:1008400_1